MNINIIELEHKNIHKLPENTTLCLGFFDGVHLGHKELIKKAKENGDEVSVLTFDISPSIFLGKKQNNHEITTLFDKAEIFDKMSVKSLLVIRFNEYVSNLMALDFIHDYLMSLSPKKIVVGSDFTFGKGGVGTPELLTSYFDVDIVPLLEIDNEKVSSRKIENFIKDGEIKKAKRSLGRPYRISGLIVHGNSNGTTIGFPTANLELADPYVMPKDGVYIGYAYIMGEKKKALICVSTHPSIMELKKPIIEVHIINFNENIYGKEISIDFIDKIRDIVKFDNLDKLKEQLNKDLILAKKCLQ
ncbi:MAG: bifunctional riboflavin kinase/FAD synthetase [Bacilli bacterium]|nr:bifunctional riboflavin kinase/FAD synthetase [Bacilli bacterium]